MIPERIALSGFLCYREPQEACFADRTLWMLAGPNGSGKSALFDAITYALFGQHRGGRQNARGLIHHDCDHFWIEFDFTLDEQRHRVRRTLSRQGRATRQISTWSAAAESDRGRWYEVAGTHTERGFAQWVDTHVALTHETFTASVLLLQGHADNLLLATPAERHRLLCQIVGLERLEQLADRAGRRLTRCEGAEKVCQAQLRQFPEQYHALADLQQCAAAARRDQERQAAVVQQLTETLEQATRWQALTRELGELQARLRRQSQQLQELRRCQSRRRLHAEQAGQVEALRQWLACTARLDTCRAAMKVLEKELETWAATRQQLETACAMAEQSVAHARQAHSDAVARERELAARQARQAETLGSARRFVRTRDNLNRVLAIQENVRIQLDTARREHRELDQQTSVNHRYRLAQDAARDMSEQLARCEVLADQAREQLGRFRGVSGRPTCPYCLQSLDEVRCAREEDRLQAELQEIEQRARQLRDQCSAARDREREWHQELQGRQQATELARRRAEQLESELHVQAALAEELSRQRECEYRELVPELQVPATGASPARCTAAAHLTGDTLLSLERTALHTAQQREEQARNQPLLQAQLDQSTAYQQRLAARRQAAAEKLAAVSAQLAERRGELAGQLALQSTLRATLPRAWLELPAQELAALARDFTQLQHELPRANDDDGGNEADLRQARHASQARWDILSEQRSALPADAQRDPESLRAMVREAQEQLQQAESECRARLEQWAHATAQENSREAARQRLRAAQQERRLCRRLVALLGRDGLQRAVLESAEHAIVQYANAILDRLAGGQLYLELQRRESRRGQGHKALDLLARTTAAGTHVQDVAFLSGSQKFRVAVAVALAIGQFASHARRPVQAVIIDEGFGCLDSANRSVMIQELQNLQGHLQRILLVSHQDEFVSAFPHGYRCELVDGATRLSPFYS